MTIENRALHELKLSVSIYVFIDISVGNEYAHYKTLLVDYQNREYEQELWRQ